MQLKQTRYNSIRKILFSIVINDLFLKDLLCHKSVLSFLLFSFNDLSIKIPKENVAIVLIGKLQLQLHLIGKIRIS